MKINNVNNAKIEKARKAIREAGCKTCEPYTDVKSYNAWREEGMQVLKGQKALMGRLFCRHQVAPIATLEKKETTKQKAQSQRKPVASVRQKKAGKWLITWKDKKGNAKRMELNDHVAALEMLQKLALSDKVSDIKMEQVS